MLVGKNNSGKSTMVKSLLLIHDFLKSKSIEYFSFGNSVIEDANIVTFDRALNHEAKKSGNDFIYFTNCIGNFEVTILITGEGDKTSAEIKKIVIKDTVSGILFIIHESTLGIKQSDVEINTEENAAITELENQIAKLKILIEESSLKPSSKEYIELIDSRTMLTKKRDELAHGLKSLGDVSNEDSEDSEVKVEADNDNEFEVNSYFGDVNDFPKIFNIAITEISSRYDLDFKKTQLGESPSEEFVNLRAFYHSKTSIESIIKAFNQTIDNLALVYLGANPAKQSALFAIRDKNNALAQAIHEYKQLNIDKDKGNDAYKFIEKWMKLFEVGDSFTAELHAGEAYEVLVSDKNSQIALADKGMGSIQAMLLIVRLGCIIAKAQKFKKDYTVIIEEPELNLHPALQSKLADLFHEVYSNYKIKLIVETHSEYLIRKTQLIVKEKEYEVKPNVNPFYTYYFDIDKGQWKMNYREDGKFVDEFGSGFYDESAILTLNLL